MSEPKHVPFPPMDAYGESFKSGFYLGDSANHKKILVSNPNQWFPGKTKPITVVHMGPDESDPSLAYLTKESTFSENTIVHVPKASGGELTVRFRTNVASLKNVTHKFSMDLGETRRTEDFEWRMATKGLIKDYGNYGFELFHLNGGNGEVVAVLGLGKSSLSKKFSFSLVGKGASGIFGREWEIVALITAIQTDKLESDRIIATAVA